MRLLSLDIATKLGWCHGDTGGGDPVSGVHALPKTGEELGPFLHSYGHWLKKLLETERIERVIFEEAIMPSGMTNLTTLLKLYGLIGMTETVCYTKQIPVFQIAAGTWKKAFCGRGNFGKSAKPYPPIARCQEMGWTVKDDNEADARGIWVTAVQRIDASSAMRFDPLFRDQQKAA